MPKPPTTSAPASLSLEAGEQRHKVRFLRQLLIAGLGAATVYSLFVLLPSPEVRSRLWLPVTGLFALFLFGLLLLRLGYVKFTGYFVVFSLWFVTTLILANGGGVRLASLGTAYATVILTAGIFLGTRFAFGMAALCITSAALMAFADTRGWITPPPDYSLEAIVITQSTLFMLIAFLLHAAVGSIAEALARARRDLVERRKAEADRELLIAELEAKNAELERFTYTVSHDLKSPLVTMQGFLGYLEQDLRRGEIGRRQEDIQRIREAANHMSGLLNDLLQLSRIGRTVNPPQLVPFADLVNEAVDRVAGQIAAGNVQIDVAADLPMVYGDRTRLIEVVQNLLDNAIKFMGTQAQPRIWIGEGMNAGQRAFFVQDNGAGIDPAYHAQVFELFNRLDQQVPGTGVGLAIVKRIVEVHEGRVWIDSEGEGQGSTFWFTLPSAASLPLESTEDYDTDGAES